MTLQGRLYGICRLQTTFSAYIALQLAQISLRLALVALRLIGLRLALGNGYGNTILAKRSAVCNDANQIVHVFLDA